MDSWLQLFANTNFRRSSDTAHDLKTPLNVAVLNLELLRMRVAKLSGGDVDEKVTGYARSIETELRRMARIFDTFFLLCVPPKSEGEPQRIDLAPLCREAAAALGYELTIDGVASCRAHESRMRQALKMFFEGASGVLRAEGRTASAACGNGRFEVAVGAKPAADDFELTKIFKFYYTDAAGNADLSLAAARLIAETYGGELNAFEERDKVVIRLSFPLGEP
jgi:nitrogen fixation/metabolism regulation signal transduction histidine kinase